MKERDDSDDIDGDGRPARDEDFTSEQSKESARDQVDAGKDSGVEVRVQVTSIEHGVRGGEQVTFVHGHDTSIKERHLYEKGQECPE